jgi:MFS family permease
LTNPSKVYSTSVIVLSLASLIENIAFMLSASYFPYYAESLGAKIEYVGIFSAAFLITSALLSQRFGGLSDRIGRKKLIQAGLLADVFLGTLTGLLQNWTLLLVVRALNGIATAAVRAPAEASLIDQVPKHKKGEALGFFLTMSMIGWFAGPVFGGSVQLFAEKQMGLRLENSYRVPFFVDSLLAIIAMGLVAWKVKETRGGDVKPVEFKENVVKLNGSVSRSLRVLYVTALANGFAIGFIALVGVLFFGGILNIPPFEIGLILSISGFVGIFCNFIGGKTADVIGRKPLIALGNLSSRLASIVLPFSTNLIEATGIMIFRSLGINVAMPATHALRADLVPEEVRGKFFGRLQAFFNAGMIIGVLLGPWIFDRYKNEVFRITWPIEISIRGHGLPFFISAVLGLTALALLLIFVEEPPRRAEKRRREG